MTNKLRIRAKSLNLDLAGEPEYILRAYDAIHPVLVERFEESVDWVLDDHDGPEAPSKFRTIRMHAVDEDAADAERAGAQHLNVVVCNEVYNKIYLVERADLHASIFSRVVDMDRVNRIFVNRSQGERFEGFIKFGKVLWRELTAAGKAAVKKT